ncbi:hypothetical protein RC77_06120 [Pectobacterium brasiliense]|nr:hypothetical protein RC77_06120 [Pectobacterium brasiliense]
MPVPSFRFRQTSIDLLPIDEYAAMIVKYRSAARKIANFHWPLIADHVAHSLLRARSGHLAGFNSYIFEMR